MMEDKEFNLFDGIELTDEQKDELKNSEKVSEIIIQMIKRRNELGMTQRDLAKMSGIKQPMIARIESLETIPRLDTLIKLSDALKMSLSFVNTINIRVDVCITKKIKYEVDNQVDCSWSFLNGSSNEIQYQA